MGFRMGVENGDFSLKKILLLMMVLGIVGFLPGAYAQSSSGGPAASDPGDAMLAGGSADMAADPTTESVRPEEPAVELPTVVLEYTAIQREELEIVLPDEDLIALPELEQQLPEAGSLRVESPVLDFGLPRQNQVGDFSEASFFSEGTIGAGSDNHLIGDIALYKRGDLPLYQFRFSHDGIDGYGENSPGTGYFDRREDLSGSIELGRAAHTVRSSMEYMEQETGLQDFSGAYSVVHRFLYGTGEYVYSFASPFSVAGKVEGHSGSRNLGSQQEESEQFLETTASLLYEGERFTADLATVYTFHKAPAEDAFHQGLIRLGIRFFGKRFDVNTGAGLHYDSDGKLLVPWDISLQGVAGERWQFGLDFGLEVEALLYRELWGEYPLLDLGVLDGAGTTWKYGGTLGYTLGRDIQLNAGLSYEKKDDVPVLTDMDKRNTLSGLFPFVLQDGEIFTAEAGVVFSSEKGTELKGGWIGRFRGDIAALDPAHSMYADLRYPGKEKGFTLGMRGEYLINPTSTLPLIDVELGYQLSKGISLMMVGSDLAAPFYDGGRPWWGEYEQRGFNLTLKTEISL